MRQSDSITEMLLKTCWLRGMTMSREMRIRMIEALAMIYNKDLSKDLIQIYLNALGDLSIEQLREGINRWVNHPTKAFFPTPGQIKATLQVTDEQEARDATARIGEALMKYGDPYGHLTHNQQRAKALIGELGWLVVERLGGWQKLSSANHPDEVGPMAQAQWRELAISLMAKN